VLLLDDGDPLTAKLPSRYAGGNQMTLYIRSKSAHSQHRRRPYDFRLSALGMLAQPWSPI